MGLYKFEASENENEKSSYRAAKNVTVISLTEHGSYMPEEESAASIILLATKKPGSLG